MTEASRKESMISTTEFKKGVKIEYDSKPFIIVDFQHVNPGKGSAFVRTRLKNLQTAQVVEITFKSGDKVPVPDLEFREMAYLYNDGTTYTFMDNASFEQYTLSKEELGDSRYYIIENSVVRLTFYRSKPIAVETDNFVNLRVIETQPNIKGDTSGGGGKPATLETGLTVTVPFHIAQGDLLKIDTRTDTYLEKVKE